MYIDNDKIKIGHIVLIGIFLLILLAIICYFYKNHDDYILSSPLDNQLVLDEMRDEYLRDSGLL